MYCAITPKTKIVIEKQRTIAAIMLPNPAKGTPSNTHIAVRTAKESADANDAKTPKIETQVSGSLL